MVHSFTFQRFYGQKPRLFVSSAKNQTYFNNFGVTNSFAFEIIIEVRHRNRKRIRKVSFFKQNQHFLRNFTRANSSFKDKLTIFVKSTSHRADSIQHIRRMVQNQWNIHQIVNTFSRNRASSYLATFLQRKA